MYSQCAEFEYAHLVTDSRLCADLDAKISVSLCARQDNVQNLSVHERHSVENTEFLGGLNLNGQLKA